MPGHDQKKRYDILVVEDNPDDIVFIEEALSETEYAITLNAVHDGNEAIDYIDRIAAGEKVQPDLIFLDLNLPRKSGLEFLGEMRGRERFKLVPVIVLTTSKAEDDIRKSYAHYANSYLVKPIDLNEFIQLIRQVTDFWFNVAVLPGGRV